MDLNLNTDRLYKDDGLNWYPFSKGRGALYCYLKEIKKENPSKIEVIIPAVTCIAVVQMIHCLGLKAVFVDLEEGNLNLDPILLEAKLGPLTLAIIHHAFSGHIPEKLYTSKDCYNILDLAQGDLLSYDLPESIDMAFMSCHWNKQIAFGLGSLMTTRKSFEFKLGAKENPWFKWTSILIRFLKKINCYQHLFRLTRYIKDSDEELLPTDSFTPLSLTNHQYTSLLEYINKLKRSDLSHIIDYLKRNRVIYFKSSSDLGEVKIILLGKNKPLIVKSGVKKNVFLYLWPRTNLSPCKNLEEWGYRAEEFPRATRFVEEAVTIVFNSKRSINKNFEFIRKNLNEFKRYE